MTKIYLVTNIDNNPYKAYIGQTRTNYRDKRHRETYGEQVEFTFIDEVKSNKREDWEPLESYWIEQFRAWGYELENKNNGGGGTIKHPKSACDKISKVHKGRKWSDEHRINHKLGIKSRKMPKGFGKKPEGFGDKISKINQNNPKMKTPRPKRQRAVVQLDKNGIFIKEWKSVKSVIEAGYKGIRGHLEGRTKLSGGYKWLLKKDYE